MPSESTPGKTADHELELQVPPPMTASGREDLEAPLRRNSATAGSAALIREGLKPNLSAAEATSQLKILCRKFAALTEKVKEETRVREEAEKEVRRLKAIIEANDAPIIASTRAENHAHIRELKEAHEGLKRDLREEKERNAKLVIKALELEREKSALLAAPPRAPSKPQDVPVPPELSRLTSWNNSSWDREQVTKIRDTLRSTIDELQEELTRKEEELSSYRERLQRERSRVKLLEHELQEREEAARDDQHVLKELESSIQEQREQFEAIEKEMQAATERFEEEETMRQTLEQQIKTLNDVNAALEQRAKTLVRRLELSHSLIGEVEELKVQVRDVEVDKETLIRSIKDVKDEHCLKETHWRSQLEQLRTEKLTLAAQIADLQNEMHSLRTQNSLLSEWMLVRSENVAAIQQQQKKHDTWNASNERNSVAQKDVGLVIDRTSQHPSRREEHYSNSARCRVRPFSSTEVDDHVYSHISAHCPLSPSKTRSMTTASPIQQSPTWIASSRRTSTSSCVSSTSEDGVTWLMKTGEEQQQSSRGGRKITSTKSILRTGSPHYSLRTENKTSKLSDHERLRELMSRNRELQNQLQLEAVTTRNLEQEISQITSQRARDVDRNH